MTTDSNEYTLTMARVYAGQGHWQKAVETYRHLVRIHPERLELRAALQAAEKELAAGGVRKLDDLQPLLERWLKLQARARQLRRLKKIRG